MLVNQSRTGDLSRLWEEAEVICTQSQIGVLACCKYFTGNKINRKPPTLMKLCLPPRLTGKVNQSIASRSLFLSFSHFLPPTSHPLESKTSSSPSEHPSICESTPPSLHYLFVEGALFSTWVYCVESSLEEKITLAKTKRVKNWTITTKQKPKQQQQTQKISDSY